MLGGGGISAGKVEVEFSTKFDSSGLKKFDKSIDSSTKNLKGLDKSIDKVDRNSGRLSRTSSKLGSSLKTGLKVGAAAAGAALAGGLVIGMKKSISAASDLEESINKSNATFEKSGKTVLKWSETASTALGMSKAAALEGASSIGAMLKPMGVVPQQAAKMSMTMTQLATDMGSFNNQDPTEMLDRIRAGLSGESEPLKRFGSVLSETRVKQHAWNVGIAEGGEELTEQQKIMARYSLLLKDTKDQQGDFEKTSKGLANQQRIFNAQLEDLSASVGKMVLPILTKLANWVTEKVVPAIQKFVEEFKNGQGAGGDFKETLESVWKIIQNLWPAIQTIGKVIFDVVRAFASLPAPVQIALASLGGLLTLSIKLFGVIKVFAALKKAAMAFFTFLRVAPAMAGPIGLALAGISIAAFLIIKNWDKVKKFLGNVWNWIKEAAKKLAEFVINAAKKGFLGPTVWIIANWDKVVAFFKKLPDKIKGMISKLGSILLKPFKWAADKVSGVLGPVFKAIKDIISGAKDAIDWAKRAKDEAKGLPKKAWEKGKDIAGDVVDWVNPFGRGGIAQPGTLGIVGDSPKPEFIISQTGPREKNIELVKMAADALGMNAFAKGGTTKMSRAEYNKRKKAANRYRTGLTNQMSLLDERYLITDRRANFDGKITASELASLKRIINQKIKNLKKQRKTFGISNFERRQIDFQIANLILDKRDLDKSFKDQAGGAGSMAEQLTAFNAERFAVLASFGGNIRTRSGATMSLRPNQGGAATAMSSSTTNNSGKQITINQEFKERPEDPHVWTRNIQNEITALI